MKTTTTIAAAGRMRSKPLSMSGTFNRLAAAAALALASQPAWGVTGACCVDFQCFQSEQAACIAIPGAYFAEGLQCDQAFCPLPALGACCTPDGGCQMSTQHECIVTLGGIYHGNNTECPAACANTCYADISPYLAPDHVVNIDDLLMVINQWGDGSGHGAWEFPGDIAPVPNGNGYIDVDDLLAVINAWGPCP